MKTVGKILAAIILLLIVVVLGAFTYLKTAFPKDGAILPVSVNKKDTVQLARGKYLVEGLVGCVDCHSPRDFSRFGLPFNLDSAGKGGLQFNHELGFPGTIYAKNITPSAIGNWTDEQLYHTITTGVNTSGETLFPVMPYPHFGKADPEDLKAIIAYIRNLKPLDGKYPPHDIDFPVNFLIQMTPEPATPVKRPSTSDTVRYGAYLFNFAGCEDCHTKMEKGKPIPGMELAGGFVFKLHGMGTVRSANITPDMETGIGGWTKELFVEKFKFFADPANQKIPWKEKGYQTVMPWIEHSALTRDDLAAIYKYLRTVKPVKNAVVKWTPEGQEQAKL